MRATTYQIVRDGCEQNEAMFWSDEEDLDGGYVDFVSLIGLIVSRESDVFYDESVVNLAETWNNGILDETFRIGSWCDFNKFSSKLQTVNLK